VNERAETGAAGFWTRMRRRKVVQWGLAYAAGASGLLQALEYVTDTFHWPERGPRLCYVHHTHSWE